MHFSKIRNLLSATIITQSLSVIIAPLLTRLYSPSDIGLYTLFISTLGMCTIITSGRYELAFAKVKGNKQKNLLFNLCLLLLLITSIALSIITYYFYFIEYAYYFLILLLLGFFTDGFLRVFRFFTISNGHYDKARNMAILAAIIIAILQLSLYEAGSYALIVSYILSYTIVSFYFFIMWKIREPILNAGSLLKVCAIAKKFNYFPKYSVLSSFLNRIGKYLPAILIIQLFGVYWGGVFAIATRVIVTPVRVFGQAVSDVFYNEVKSENKHIVSKYFAKYFTFLSYLILSPTVVLFIYSVPIFNFVFGSEWSKTGDVISILCPMLYFSFTMGTLSRTAFLLGKPKIDLLFQFCLAFVRICSLAIAYYLEFDFLHSVYIFSILSCIVYFVYLLYFFFILKINFFSKLYESIISFIPVTPFFIIENSSHQELWVVQCLLSLLLYLAGGVYFFRRWNKHA